MHKLLLTKLNIYSFINFNSTLQLLCYLKVIFYFCLLECKRYESQNGNYDPKGSGMFVLNIAYGRNVRNIKGHGNIKFSYLFLFNRLIFVKLFRSLKIQKNFEWIDGKDQRYFFPLLFSFIVGYQLRCLKKSKDFNSVQIIF